MDRSIVWPAMRLMPIALLLGCAACAVMDPPPEIVASPSVDWRAVATGSDRVRLRDWRSAFTSALASARAGGYAADVAREGVLLQPDAALAGEPITAGMYRCRVIKIGAKTEGMLEYVNYPYFSCRVEQEGRVQEFAKLTGSQRQVGRIFPGDAMRQVFLGTLMLGDEGRAMQYGVDPERDVAGFVERIGPQRWRLIMPRPHFESQIDVMELVPAN
ncbi:MAG TPA: DUF4893 domain-containing protein [Sphingomicrobium sp.]|nr:DUF4893 domain-containing protein [Sphingomicrobium sp.]